MNPEEQKMLDRLAAERREATGQTDIDPNKQGISNRPGDEEPETGVDRAPGPDLTRPPGEN